MEEWVELLITGDEIEAEIVKDILEGEKIQVVVKSLKISPYPVSIGKMGEIRLLVRHEELDRANRVLDAMKQEPGPDKNDY